MCQSLLWTIIMVHDSKVYKILLVLVLVKLTNPFSFYLVTVLVKFVKYSLF